MKIRINGTEMPDNCKCNCEKGDSVMVFVDRQEIGEVYMPSEAFSAGTLYPEMRKPFLAGGCP